MMSIPLGETASIWASAAALTAVAFAWATYCAAARTSRVRTHEGLVNTIDGIRQELEQIVLWAGDEKRGEGYSKLKKPEQYFAEKLDWSNPSRTIFTFDYPAIKNITASGYVSLLKPIIKDFVILNYSIVRLYNFYDEYRRYVMLRPELYDSVASKFHLVQKSGAPSPEHFKPAEIAYTKQVFAYNYQIHVQFIGGKDSGDERCLFHAFNRARRTLNQFAAAHQKPQRAPWWHWIGHFVAGTFFVGAVILLLEWRGVTHWPSPTF